MPDYSVKKLIYLLLIFLLSGNAAFAQLTKVIGSVHDAHSGEPLPFVNILLKGSTYGITTDFKGNFSMETRQKGDTITVSYIGYKTQQIRLEPGHFQQIHIKLEPINLMLNEVVIEPGENPAEILLKKLINAKKDNSRESLKTYQYEAYTKIQFDANNIAEKLKDRRALRKMKFVFDYVDTSTISGKAYLPLLLTETLSEVYYRTEPESSREVIKALKVSGVDNESIGQFLGNMYQEVYIYDNYIRLFDKNFVSPVANFALAYYRYYLVDSAYISNQWCYKLQFRPRRKQELTFTGNIWVHDTTYAVRIVDMKVEETANLNFVNHILVYQEYEQVNADKWMLTQDNLLVDFNPIGDSKLAMGFFGRKTSSYKKYMIDSEAPKEVFSSKPSITVSPDALKHDEAYWASMRHDSLSRDEKTIYWLIDTVSNLPVFRTWVDVVQMVATGYYVWNMVELGPYMSTLSFNEVEGARFRLGGRTSNAWSTRLMLFTHLAYGSRDEKLKYKAGALYMFAKHPRRSAGIEFKHDLEQLGKSQNAFREDFLLASLLRRNPADKFSMVEEYKGFYEHEWFPGFSTTASLVHRIINPPLTSSFTLKTCPQCGDYKSRLRTSELKMNLHFAWNEKFVFGEFERISLGTTWPVFDLTWVYGKKGILKSDYNYNILLFQAKQWFNVGTIGWSKYIAEAGQIFGVLPYPLLKLHEGNETFTFDEYAFNSMNYYEFVSDRYISLFYTHHFDGLFFNRIPYFRKLKLREVIFGRGLMGTLSDANRNFVSFTPGLSPLSKPYFEGGVGVENIFRLLRVDAIWRFSYLDHQNISPFALLLTLQFYL